MRRLLITLLATITLMSQWGWKAHAYLDHSGDDAGHICELCVTASSHVAITPSSPVIPTAHGSDFVAPTASVSFVSAAPRYYPTRAPPASL